MKIIACVGLKRSGSTMQFAYLKQALDLSGTQYANLQYLFPTESAGDVDWPTLDKDGNEFVLFKSHDVKILELLPPGCEVKTIFIYRDLRDTYLSMKEKIGCGKERIPEVVDNYEFSLAYVDRLSDKLVQNYEHFFDNKEPSISEMLNYIGLNLSKAEVAKLAGGETKPAAWKSFAFGCLKRAVVLRKRSGIPTTAVEKKLGRLVYGPVLSAMTDPDTQLHPDHFSKRKGAPGGWVEGLTDEEKQLFEELHVCGPVPADRSGTGIMK